MGLHALTYVLDDPTDRGLKQLIHSLTGHPEHPLGRPLHKVHTVGEGDTGWPRCLLPLLDRGPCPLPIAPWKSCWECPTGNADVIVHMVYKGWTLALLYPTLLSAWLMREMVEQLTLSSE